MKIAIIGAGFTGLSAGLKLIKLGHEITIFEKEPFPGGLATGFENPKWQWTLEKHYHHWFTNDKGILALAREMGHEVLVQRPKTSVYIDDSIFQFDSFFNVLSFSKLSFIEKVRMGLTLGILKINPFWKPLEKHKASDLLPKVMGKKAYETLWKPLLIKKFRPFADNISLAWFWARIKKRTPSLVYPKGGFLEFANKIANFINKKGGRVFLNSEVKKIEKKKDELSIELTNGKILNFEKAIVTSPTSLFIKITPQLPKGYVKKLSSLKVLSALNLVLRLKKPFLKDGTYWLNICDQKYPLTAIVEHTNFMDKKYYNNEHLLYLGNYLPHNHPFIKFSKDKLLKIYHPLLNKINKQYESTIIESELFIDPFAQPVIPVNYSKLNPLFETPLKYIYLANMQQVYPWDRGTNYAVELGKKVADVILKK